MKRSSSNALFVWGIVFGILSLVLFILSVQHVDLGVYGDIDVANIPLIVFSAASFIASVVNFVGVLIVENNKRESEHLSSVIANSEKRIVESVKSNMLSVAANNPVSSSQNNISGADVSSTVSVNMPVRNYQCPVCKAWVKSSDKTCFKCGRALNG